MSASFVTGAHGLVGGWLVKALLARGERVVVLRRPGHRPPSALELEGTQARCAVVDGDVRDGELLERVLVEHGVDTVFHLAAQALAGPAHERPGPTLDVNVRGTWTLLDACRRHGCPRTVVSSSAAAYGPGHELPHREDQALRPTAPAGAANAAADVIARSLWPAYGLPVAVARPTNVYGGGDRNASRLVPAAVAAALAGQPPALRSDGSPQRDFLYVEDAAAAYLALADALRAPNGGARGEAFNVGAGRAHRVGEVVELVGRLAGAPVALAPAGASGPGEDDRVWVDTARLRALTGWAPRVDLEEGLARTVAWYRRHPQVLAEAPGVGRDGAPV